MHRKIVTSTSVFEGKVFNVRIDQIESDIGQEQRIDYVEHAGGVTIVPVDNQMRIYFVRQYRHPAREILLELPAGSLENGEDAESCARREAREEIGMSPGRLHRLGGTYLAPGYSTEMLQYFLAEELSPAPLPPDEDEEIEIVLLSWEEALQKITRNEIRDAKSITGIFLAGLHLGKWRTSDS